VVAGVGYSQRIDFAITVLKEEVSAAPNSIVEKTVLKEPLL